MWKSSTSTIRASVNSVVRRQELSTLTTASTTTQAITKQNHGTSRVMSTAATGIGGADKWGAYTTPYEVQQAQKALHLNLIPKADHGEFLEYSVIHTDRSLNLMSSPFQQVMRDLNTLLKVTYSADKVAIMPGYVLL